jgi:hypothetical protein
MESIKKGGTLPPPFNIIPTPKSFFYLLYKPLVKIIKHSRAGVHGNGMDSKDFERPGGSNANGAPRGGGTARKGQNGDVLTYKVVMQRIVKRFLLHSQRESEGFEKEFEELKQDLQMIRYEMANDLKRTKEEQFQSMNLMHTGLNLLGDEILAASKNHKLIHKFNEYRLLSNELAETLKDDLMTLDGHLDEDIETIKSKLYPSSAQSKKNKDISAMRKSISFFHVVNTALNSTTSATTNPDSQETLIEGSEDCSAGSSSKNEAPQLTSQNVVIEDDEQEIVENGGEENAAEIQAANSALADNAATSSSNNSSVHYNKQVSFSDVDTVHQIVSSNSMMNGSDSLNTMNEEDQIAPSPL